MAFRLVNRAGTFKKLARVTERTFTASTAVGFVGGGVVGTTACLVDMFEKRTITPEQLMLIPAGIGVGTAVGVAFPFAVVVTPVAGAIHLAQRAQASPEPSKNT